MTTATLATGNRTMTDVRLRRSLEELVDRLIAALFKEEEPEAEQAAETPSVAKSLHEARRLRQAGDVDRAVAALAGTDTTKAEPHQARWAYAEWTDLVRRRFGDRGRAGLQPGRGTGRRPGARRKRRDAGGGRGGPGNAVAARQGRLGAQPPGAPALGEGLPSALTGEWPGAGVAQATVDDS